MSDRLALFSGFLRSIWCNKRFVKMNSLGGGGGGGGREEEEEEERMERQH